MIIYDDDGIGYDVIPRKAIDDIKAEFISQYPQNIYGDLELGGRSCVFSLNKVLEIIDKYTGESDCHSCKTEHDCYECKKYAESEE